jgi:hypothetical protein
VLGIKLFKDTAPQHFSTFQLAILAVLSITTGEGWDIGRGLVLKQSVDEHGETVWGVHVVAAIYFCTFLLLSNVILLNVVMAVLVDEFIRSVEQQHEEDRAEKLDAACQVCFPFRIPPPVFVFFLRFVFFVLSEFSLHSKLIFPCVSLLCFFLSGYGQCYFPGPIAQGALCHVP